MEPISGKGTWGKIAFGVLFAGFALHLALPPVDCWILAWVAFVPLLRAIRGTRFIVGFLASLAALGVTSALAIEGVAYEVRNVAGEKSWILIGCAFFAFVLSIVVGIFGESKVTSIWGLAGLAVLLESLLLALLPVSVAVTQSGFAGMHLIASVGGVWLVSFLLWFANLSLASTERSGFLKAVGILVALLIVCSLGEYGRIAWFSRSESERRVEVVLVQTESPELEVLSRLSGLGRPDLPTLAVWPEFSGLMWVRDGDARELVEASMRKGSPAFVTSFPEGSKPMPYNAAALFYRGAESERYFKRKPFGAESKMHAAGEKPLVVALENVRVGLNICFDSCFPGVMRDTALEGAEVIALPTIDPPSPNHWIAAMHAAYSPLRSAELGIPIARADGYAYSNVTDGFGRVILQLEAGERSARTLVVPSRTPTLYRILGDLFLYLAGIAAIAPLALRKMGSRKETPQREPSEL